jgi:hypothetical protein
MIEYKFSEFSLENLKAIREVIQVEEGCEVSIGETLRRVSAFINRLVSII